jgi:hypothetical protein
VRRILGGLIFATILLGGLVPLRWRVPNPDRRTRDYPAFLQEVAARTRPGDSIVIVVPIRYWRTGYGYAYYRASYFLAGRRAIPILDDDDRLRRERLAQTDYVALWRMPELPGYSVVWRGHGGVLMRRAS